MRRSRVLPVVAFMMLVGMFTGYVVMTAVQSGPAAPAWHERDAAGGFQA
jgi:xanthosine utilization system XapX-like protein